MFNKVYEIIKKFIKEYGLSLLIIGFFAFASLYEFPYVIYTPGGIVTLDDRISMSDAYSEEGSFNMSYVTLRRGTLVNIGLSYLLKNWDLMDKDEVTAEDESVDELLELERLYMQSSIDNATIVAYHNAGKEIEITRNVNNIVYITDDAKTDLKVYDEVLEVEGIEIKDIDELKEIINTKESGDTVSLVVRRDGKNVNCEAEIYDTTDGLKIGIMFLTTYEYEETPSLEVKTKSSESGSSGGLMMSLAIYNKLVEEDITKGRTIVGTGTIDINGNVGAIDGIKYKLLGAVKNKADLFLCPIDNYEEAISVKEELDLNLDIIAVESFDDALVKLK